MVLYDAGLVIIIMVINGITIIIFFFSFFKLTWYSIPRWMAVKNIKTSRKSRVTPKKRKRKKKSRKKERVR